MKAVSIGGGPGGLMTAILVKKADPSNHVVVYERNAADETFGFGVVFSQETLDNLRDADAELFAEVQARFRIWSAMDVDYLGFTERSDGHAFAALARKELLAMLGARATELGVEVNYSTPAPPHAELERDFDVVIASDGVHSRTRTLLAETFEPSVHQRVNKYVWFGTTRPIDCFTFVFITTPHGMFWAHIYPFNDTMSTFIVETDPETWRRAGLDEFASEAAASGTDDDRSREYCERIFADYLDGHPLIGNKSTWLNFNQVANKRWTAGTTVLVGDAAHTAHFSIGSGTKLALEDAISLGTALVTEPTVADALVRYEAERHPLAASIQRSAKTSLEWFEGVQRYIDLPPEQFVFQLLTRSQRITYDNLKLRDPLFMRRLDDWFAQTSRANGLVVADGTPPMFYPYKIGNLELDNRIVVSPMAQYSAVDGVPNNWHLVHLGGRAVGGAGLVFTEMACVSADARITPGCPGIWSDEQANAWAGIVDFIHGNSASKIGLQIGHAGRKGSTKVMWEGIDEPLETGNWPLVGPSAIGYRPDSDVPRAMTIADMDAVVADHARSAALGDRAGFDILELHAAHGYLLSSFLSPLSNQRSDEFGGSLENRARFPLRVVDAVRAAWPAEKPLSVRISATDWVTGGFSGDDAVEFAAMLKAHGVDIVDVSTGQTSVEARPEYGRLYQTPFADRIRHEVGIPTMAVGAISSVDDANTIIMAGRADLCLIARPHLVDPYWTLNAAIDQGFRDAAVPKQYGSGMSARRRVQQS